MSKRPTAVAIAVLVPTPSVDADEQRFAVAGRHGHRPAEAAEAAHDLRASRRGDVAAHQFDRAIARRHINAGRCV